MKTRWLSWLLLCLPLAVPAQHNIDVLHYRFHLTLSDSNDSLIGTAIIRFAVQGTNPELVFDLASVKQSGKGMLVTAVAFQNPDGEMVNFRQSGDKLLISSKFSKGDTGEVMITYKGIPENGLIISRNKFGKRTFFADNWPNRAHYWIPCVDDPADKASVEFFVVAPTHYQVVGNGFLEEETNQPGGLKETHWKEKVPLPTKVMVIGVAEFAVQNLGMINNCIPVSSWVFPENRQEGFYDYATAKEVLAWHMNYIGPYAYSKLANVQSKTMFGGMENASAIFYYEGSVSGNRAEEELQSHEIVHQWFGNHATEKSFAHLWLSEGFATYLTHVYIESKYGSDSLMKRMRADRETVLEFVSMSKRPVVDTTSDYMRLLNANSYQKGSWVLHMLRLQLGDSVFHKSIRDYYAAFAGKNADTRDLQKIFETNSGKKLDAFFEQWLYRPVNPELDIAWHFDAAKSKLDITVKQLQEGAAFIFPLELGLKYSDKYPEFKTIEVTEKTQSFTIEGIRSLVDVYPDPNVSLLFSGKVHAN